jgi:hypothetical protein
MTVTRTPGWREVLIVAAATVAVVLAIQLVSQFVPALDGIVQGTPILVLILVVGTVFILWQLATRRPSGP